MKTSNSNLHSDRRNFLTKCFAAGSMVCFGCLGAAAAISKPCNAEDLPQSGMTNEEALRFALSYSLPILLKMQTQMGKQAFFDVLEKSASANLAEKISGMSKDIPDRSMKKFGGLITKMLLSPPLQDGFKYEIIENSDKVFEVKFTECIMARLYREKNAFNIGFAIECHPMDAAVKAFNPNAKCIKSKNMMIGDPFCTERFELA
jgi:predicted metal-binding transcription factor (methanogenesis marker protein 9)